MEDVYASFPSSRGAVQVTRQLWRGKVRLDIREFVLPSEAGVLSPTRKGVSLPIDLVRPLREALERMEGDAVLSGLVPEVDGRSAPCGEAEGV